MAALLPLHKAASTALLERQTEHPNLLNIDMKKREWKGKKTRRRGEEREEVRRGEERKSRKIALVF